MPELIDKLIIRIVLTVFICLLLFIYKYAHTIFYPSSRGQLFKRFYPSKNSPDTIHLFSRIIGLGLIFSEFYFYMADGIFIALLDFCIRAIISFCIYLLSIYIMESIVLYNFEYSDEIIKRKNYAYALVSFSHALGSAYILKSILVVSQNSMILLMLLWMFSIMILGFATKFYSFFSKLPFNRLLIQKNMAVSISYTGYIWGWSLIIAGAINHPAVDLKLYILHIILKIILAIIIYPIFRKGLIIIFKVKDDLTINLKSNTGKEIYGPETGYGIYEGALFLTSCFLTSVIAGHINFDTFYPQF